jgi:hypothetical protein
MDNARRLVGPVYEAVNELGCKLPREARPIRAAERRKTLATGAKTKRDSAQHQEKPVVFREEIT